ncbi:unnamed protein product [Cylindrotheca closterium]|uniref:Uncharacterized protein n=1 Tax=Cylindrotheca closterium TaxID=2856 RepID=A0AAD2FRE7_9STRA|nr:unnamed protein product [Cylindrotheca closterium]
MSRLTSMKWILLLAPFLLEIGSLVCAYSTPEPRSLSRRAALATAFSAMAAPLPVLAAPDCFKDCMKNCKLIAPKDPDYCLANCKGYCEQEDRNDGLSGSVSSSSGEVGILGGTFGQGTVAKGDDKPPTLNLPGLDFTNEKGKKLIGY